VSDVQKIYFGIGPGPVAEPGAPAGGNDRVIMAKLMPRSLVVRRRWILFGIAAPMLAGCAAPWADLPPVRPADIRSYHLGPGDRVRVITVGEQDLTGEFNVSDSGNIAVPMLGEVHAAGLTPALLADRIAGGLRRTRLFKNPSVSVEVVSYRPVFILGEVNKPGQYPFQPGETVLTAVAVAGGFTYRAVTDGFSVLRTINGVAVEGRARRQTFLQPGDVLTVYERHF